MKSIVGELKTEGEFVMLGVTHTNTLTQHTHTHTHSAYVPETQIYSIGNRKRDHRRIIFTSICGDMAKRENMQ